MAPDGEVRLVDGFSGPNGLVFSLDERRLFVSDSRANHIPVFDVRENGTLSEDEVFTECAAQLQDDGREGDFRDGERPESAPRDKRPAACHGHRQRRWAGAAAHSAGACPALRTRPAALSAGEP